MYNVIQRVTRSYNLVVNLVYNFTRISSKIWKKNIIVYCILCKYVNQICAYVIYTYLLKSAFNFFYTTTNIFMGL